MISIKNEILRKGIHLSSLAVPLFLHLYGRYFTLLFLVPITFSFVVLDLLRINNQIVRNSYNFFFNSITREKESGRLTGASYVFIASTFIVFVFPESIAIAALMIMSISDTFAAIIGRLYGSIFIGRKSIEGSVSFFITSLAIVLLFSDLNISISIICILIATIVELYTPINDNLSIPVAFAGTYTLLNTITKMSGVL